MTTCSRHTLTLLFILSLLSGCNNTTQFSKTDNTTAINSPADLAKVTTTQLYRLINESWRYRQSNEPIGASFNGINDYNDRLPDLSSQGLAHYDLGLQNYVKQLEALDRQSLSAEDIINLDILLRQIYDSIDRYRFKAHYMPLTAESGFHGTVAFLPSIMPFATPQDYTNYLSRLDALPQYFQQNIAWMKLGIKTGLTLPKAVLDGYENGIARFIVTDVKQSVYFQPFEGKIPTALSETQFADYRDRAIELINNKVIPAYQQYYDFMVNSYIPNARSTVGISQVPDGIALYTNRVKYYTTMDITADEVHQLGLSEVARIRAEMEQIIVELKFNGSFADFVQFLRTDPQFYATTPLQLLKEASFIAKKMDAKLPSLFKHLPRTPYGVAPVPDHLAPKYTTGRYIGASRDDQPGYYWINTYSLDKRPLYVLEALTLHEAVPGHHLQNSINRELTDVPPHRKFEYISAFGEGWGLYAEFLGLEAGFYQDPYSNFGRLTYEMWRACRLVVDTGLHSKGWSRQQAIDFLASNTALSTHNVETEIDRYITWPGQALSYKMGELTIKRLRKAAEAALRDKFDIREFHDEILKHGSVPLKVLEQLILAYIEDKLSGNAPTKSHTPIGA